MVKTERKSFKPERKELQNHTENMDIERSVAVTT